MNTEHNAELVGLGAFLVGVSEGEVLKTRETADKGMVVINRAGQKFVYDAATVTEAAEKQAAGGKPKVKQFETVAQKERKFAANVRKKKKNAAEEQE